MKEIPLEKINNAKEQIIEKIADNMHTFGVSSTLGRVLGIIYMNRKPMTLDELSEETGMSKTRMSQVIREMIDLDIAKRVFKKGVRKDLYHVEQDYYQTFISLFTSNWRKTINKNRKFEQRLRQELVDIQKTEQLDTETEKKVNELLKETKEWLDYYNWLTRLTEFFESGEVFKYVPKHDTEEGLNDRGRKE
ncbi:GbsR/MarR family transcriptional regulator [Kroppenstedtia pulmonis]|uniref:HTH-type transcriptional regulator n=1 Tax=Kroppenstedtia pulmonis TaxID=1380685 RepID=A0A7D3XHM2_9BACL|nr:GbsR/MarR family transcriptional regulator [Kroppenstedtia pulmonis]QKG83744.1 GbsR/MarR family transcriptional regulator [Kroppenstedtia pulmonis]